MARNPLHFGVVVGINRYPDIRHLRLAKGDADKFAQWLLNPAGGGLLSNRDADKLVPAGHVATIVVDDAAVPDGLPRENARPVRKEVFQALHGFRKAVEQRVEAHPKDWYSTRLYFYVSGHGIAPDARDAALLLADAGQEAYDENISCDRLLSFLGKRQPFREVVIFADCCRERVGSVPLGAVPGTLGDKDNGAVLTAFCCATYFGDLAYEPPVGEDPDMQRGYFTRALLEGLGGEAAEPPGYGVIDSNTLANYVKQRVRDLTKHRKPQQDPKFESDPSAPIVFRAPAPPHESSGLPAGEGLSAKVEHEVRIEFVTPYKGTVALRDTNNNVMREHQTANGDLVVSLPNGLYEVTAEDAGSAFPKGGGFRVLGDRKHVQL
jgi:hypothetical protein